MTKLIKEKYYNLSEHDVTPMIETCGVTDEWVIENYSHLNLKLLSNPKARDEYNVCFNYALNLDDDEVYSCSGAMKILSRDYYQIDIKDLLKSDIVSFHTDIPDTYNSNHFAIVDSPSDKIEQIIIRSKWGTWGVFLSDFEALPEEYGEYILFWRKK